MAKQHYDWPGIALFATSLCVSLWIYFRIPPYGLAVLAGIILPWFGIAMAMWSREPVVFAESNGKLWPNVFAFSLLPALPLGWRALSDVSMIDPTPVVVAAVTTSLLLSVIAFLGQRFRKPAKRRYHWITFAITLFFGLSYGSGAAILADTIGDTGVAATYTANVASKHASTDSKTHSTTYILKLAAWPSRPNGSVERVSHDMYENVAPGSEVCIDTYRGRFGWRWYRVHAYPCV